ncbi:MAG: SGNH/GDSL hydrolase family protein [Anaerolineales bacterium]
MGFTTPTHAGSGTPPAAIPTNSADGSSPTAEWDWRYVPVMPEIGQRAFEIYRNGQSQGRNPHNFSVIGDCQAIPLVFMGPFERGELQPDSSESYLWDAIRQFTGSFSRTGMAVRGGFNAASILSPLQADPHYCLSGETPLTCEYRLHNPSIVFIMLETWLDPGTIDRYETYLRQILDYVIAKGSVPILMTKADMAEMGNGVPVINPAIVRVAQAYDVPLINFWRSAQNLENGGIDPSREGFHLSPEGFKLKNILALRTLYKLWTQVEKWNGNQGATEEAGTPTATPTLSDIPTSQNGLQINIPDCTGGCIYTGTAVSRDGVVTAHGVLAFNYLTRQLTQMLGEGFDLQDVSEDGRRMLVNNANNLYEINLGDSSARLISNSFFASGKQDAYWNADDSRIVYLDRNHPIRTETGEAFNLFPSTRDGEIYFESGSCAGKANCQSGGVYRLDSNQNLTRLDSYSQIVFSADGQKAAFLDPSAATKDNYFHNPFLLVEEVEQGAKSRKGIYFPGEKGFMVNPDVRDYAFSPGNDRLFILFDVYSDYYERSLRLQTYAYDLSSRNLSDLGEITGTGGSLNPRLVWAPRENKVLLFLTEMNSENQYSMSVFQAALDNSEGVTPYAPGIMTNVEYFYLTNLFWRQA